MEELGCLTSKLFRTTFPPFLPHTLLSDPKFTVLWRDTFLDTYFSPLGLCVVGVYDQQVPGIVRRSRGESGKSTDGLERDWWLGLVNGGSWLAWKTSEWKVNVRN